MSAFLHLLNAEAKEYRERFNYLNGTNDDGTLNEHGKKFDYDNNGCLAGKERIDLWSDGVDWSQFNGGGTGGGPQIGF